jgi:hypothetical protein
VCEGSGSTVGDSVAGQDLTLNASSVSWGFYTLNPDYTGDPYVTNLDGTGRQITGTSAAIGTNGPFSFAILLQTVATPLDQFAQFSLAPINKSMSLLGLYDFAGFDMNKVVGGRAAGPHGVADPGFAGFEVSEFMDGSTPALALDVGCVGNPFLQAIYPARFVMGTGTFSSPPWTALRQSPAPKCIWMAWPSPRTPGTA